MKKYRIITVHDAGTHYVVEERKFIAWKPIRIGLAVRTFPELHQAITVVRNRLQLAYLSKDHFIIHGTYGR